MLNELILLDISGMHCSGQYFGGLNVRPRRDHRASRASEHAGTWPWLICAITHCLLLTPRSEAHVFLLDADHALLSALATFYAVKDILRFVSLSKSSFSWHLFDTSLTLNQTISAKLVKKTLAISPNSLLTAKLPSFSAFTALLSRQESVYSLKLADKSSDGFSDHVFPCELWLIACKLFELSCLSCGRCLNCLKRNYSFFSEKIYEEWFQLYKYLRAPLLRRHFVAFF